MPDLWQMIKTSNLYLIKYRNEFSLIKCELNQTDSKSRVFVTRCYDHLIETICNMVI